MSATEATAQSAEENVEAHVEVPIPAPPPSVPSYYGIQSNLPVPSRLDMSGNIAENWKKWKQVWDSFEIASRLNQQENKYRMATFITCIGSEALEVSNGLPFEAEEDKRVMSKVLELTERHCIGQINVIYKRYCFNNRNQESGESFDAYLTALRTLTKTCNFGPLTDELIHDRIVCGIRDTGTRKKLLQEAKLTLQRCINNVSICRNNRDANESYDVNALNQKGKKVWKSKSDTSVVDCKFSGRKHERSRDKCPAFGKECTKCGKANHFSSLCKQRSVHPKRKKEQFHHVQNSKRSDDDDDNDYCFTISLENQEGEEIVIKVDSQPIKSKIFAMMKVEGHPVRFQVDSGATCNVISANDLPNRCQIEHSKQVLSMFNGSQMEAIGKCRVNLLNPKVNKEYKAEFVVVNEHCTTLLGSKTVQQMNLVEVH